MAAPESHTQLGTLSPHPTGTKDEEQYSGPENFSGRVTLSANGTQAMVPRMEQRRGGLSTLLLEAPAQGLWLGLMRELDSAQYLRAR
jgi:hypothetical protein